MQDELSEKYRDKISALAINLNTQKAWHHVATTFDGTNYKLFLDGELINNSTAFQGLTPPDTEPVRIIGKKPWVGKIDEVRIYLHIKLCRYFVRCDDLKLELKKGCHSCWCFLPFDRHWVWWLQWWL